MSQVSIFESLPIEPPHSHPGELAPGHDVIDDMHAVSARVPWAGRASGTSRANSRRPIAYLYFRPDLVTDDQHRERCFERAEVVTGDRGIREAFELELLGPIAQRGNTASHGDGWWVRVMGEIAGPEGRNSMRARRRSEPDGCAWMLAPRYSPSAAMIPGGATIAADRYFPPVLAAARLAGCVVVGQTIYAESISQLVLASHWAPEFVTAIGLAIAGCNPRSDDWTVTIDAALSDGQPWAVALARLARRPARDVLRRALAWLYDHKRIA